MRFDRKFYVVAMVIFAVFLFTTNVYAANMTVTGVNGTITLEGKLFVETEWTPLTPDASGFLKLSGTQEIIFTITPEPSYQLDNVLVHGCEYLPNPLDLDYINEVPGYCSSSTPPTTDSHFSQVSVDENGVITYHFVKPQTGDPDPQAGDYSFEAVFAPIPMITYNASAGSNGAISPSGTFSVPEGSSTTFTITPDEYYQVADVFVDGTSIGAITSVPFDNSMAGHTITASFEPIPVVAAFGPSPDNADITAGDQVQFSADASQGNLTYWEWYIDSVLISSEQVPPPFIFADAGPYTVQLKVGNAAIFHTVSAVYTVANDQPKPVSVGSGNTMSEHDSVMEAYYVIPNEGETIKMLAGEITEDLWFNDAVSFILKGGYDDIFAADDGFTKIKGYVKISHGTVTLSKVIIAPAI